jgi:hypothetical protein
MGVKPKRQKLRPPWCFLSHETENSFIIFFSRSKQNKKGSDKKHAQALKKHAPYIGKNQPGF